jgi:hypothetical protein
MVCMLEGSAKSLFVIAALVPSITIYNAIRCVRHGSRDPSQVSTISQKSRTTRLWWLPGLVSHRHCLFFERTKKIVVFNNLVWAVIRDHHLLEFFFRHCTGISIDHDRSITMDRWNLIVYPETEELQATVETFFAKTTSVGIVLLGRPNLKKVLLKLLNSTTRMYLRHRAESRTTRTHTSPKSDEMPPTYCNFCWPILFYTKLWVRPSFHTQAVEDMANLASERGFDRNDNKGAFPTKRNLAPRDCRFP